MEILPTRTLTVVIDPYCLDDTPAKARLLAAIVLVEDLSELDPPVTIQLVFPAYLASESQLSSIRTDILPFTVFFDEATVPPLVLSRDIRRGLRAPIERGAEGECRGLRLLSLAQHLKADGIVTTIPSLLQARYDLLGHHKFRIVPPEDLGDFVEVCGRGHGVPCSARTDRSLPPDLLHVFTHWKGRRLAEWFNKVSPTMTNNTLRECIRSALLNRYTFIITARDLVRFHEVQTDHYFRHNGKRGVFRGLLNYHLTSFYFHVWGMLDALTGIANLQLGLDLHPRQCGITNDTFLGSLNHRRPNLYRFIKNYGPRWVSVIGDVRHPAAHSALLLQRDIMSSTPESQKSDDEIVAILKEEDPVFYVKDEAYTRHMMPTAIYLWRVNHMKVVMDDAIYVEHPSGGYFRPAVTSIDYDLEMLNAFVDAFLITCFARS